MYKRGLLAYAGAWADRRGSGLVAGRRSWDRFNAETQRRKRVTAEAEDGGVPHSARFRASPPSKEQALSAFLRFYRDELKVKCQNEPPSRQGTCALLFTFVIP